MYLLETVKIQSYRQLKDVEAEFREGINVILGDNGEGKTNLIESIIWALNGAKGLKDVVEADLVNDQTGEAPDVSVTLKSEKHTIKIHRTKSGAKLYKDGKKLAASKMGVGELITQEFSATVSSIRATTWCPQPQLHDIIHSNETHRMKAIEEILGYECIAMAIKALESNLAEMRRKASIVALASVGSLKTQIQDLKQEIEAHQHSKSELTPPPLDDLEQVGLKVASLTEQAVVAKSLWDEIGRRNATMNHIETRLQEATGNLQAIQKANPHEPKDRKSELELCYNKLSSLNSEVKVLTNSVASNKNTLRHLVETTPVVTKPDKPNPSEEELKALQAAFQEQEQLWNRAQNNSVEISEHLQSILNDGNACSRCGTPLTKKHEAFLRDDLKKQKEIIERVTPFMESRLVELNEALDAREAWTLWLTHEQHLKRVYEEKERLDKAIVSDSDKLNSLVNQLAGTKAEYEALQKDQSQRVLWEEATKKIPVLTDLINSFQENLDKMSKDVLELTDQYNDVFPVFAQLESAQIDLKQLQELKRSYDDQVLYYNRMITRAEEALKTKTEELQSQEKEAVDFQAMELEEATLKSMVQFRKDQQRSIVPECEFYLRQFYQEFGFYADVRINSQFQPEVLEGTVWRKFKNLSDGQKDSLALCLRLSLSQAKIKSNRVLGFIALDEPTARYQKGRVSQFVELLSKVQNIVPQVICVSHDEAVAESADRIYTLKRVKGIPTLTIG